jgi:hypothetical protein
MQELEDFVAAVAHFFEPLLRDRSQVAWLLLEPSFDLGVPIDSPSESQKF